MCEEVGRLQTNEMRFVFLEQSLHRTPQKMASAVQDAIDTAEDWNGDYIVLGYGLCSNGVRGVKSKRHPIVIPRVHDCVALFLGSAQRYAEEHNKEPGTYFLTKGWIDEGKSPLGIYKEYHERYDKETAEWVIREEFKNYTRLVLVETGSEITEADREHGRESAKFLGLRFELMKGSSVFFERMFRGPWGEEFLVINPGQQITEEGFLRS